MGQLRWKGGGGGSVHNKRLKGGVVVVVGGVCVWIINDGKGVCACV